MPSTSLEPGDHHFSNLLLCSSIFSDEQYLSFLVCGSHNFIVYLLFVLPMKDPSCVLSYKFLVDDVMGYISHPNVISSWMIGFLPYHAKLGEVLPNALCILVYGRLLVSLLHSTIFAC